MATNYSRQGDHITILESLMQHPTHSDGFVNSGDPVRVNKLHGVALLDAAAATDSIPIATEGVWNLTVSANDGSSSAVAVGNYIYIGSTATLSKLATDLLFGIALETITISGTATIAVKLVH